MHVQAANRNPAVQVGVSGGHTATLSTNVIAPVCALGFVERSLTLKIDVGTEKFMSNRVQFAGMMPSATEAEVALVESNTSSLRSFVAVPPERAHTNSLRRLPEPAACSCCTMKYAPRKKAKLG